MRRAGLLLAGLLLAGLLLQGCRLLPGDFARKRATGEQDAIAEAAGTTPLGAARAWEIRHTIPIGNRRGALEAVREFATPIATCREIVFTVVDGEERDVLTTTLCRQAEGWRWAAAEPAVDRWGFLH